MPTNLFDQPPKLRGRVSRNLGFDPSAMIQAQEPQIMQDVEERRQMGRRKYSQDILQQQGQTAAQELANQVAGYGFSRTKAHDESFADPEMQAMIKAYQESGHMPFTGPIRSPEQLHDMEGLQAGASKTEQENKQIAGQLLLYSQPGTPQYEWASKVLGFSAPSTNAPALSKTATTPTGSGRSASGVFMHELAPYVGGGVGTWAGVKAGAKTGKPWGPAVGGITGFGLGRFATEAGLDAMGAGQLTSEESAAHPVARGAGNLAGILMSLLAGGKAYKGKPGGEGLVGGEAGPMSAMKNALSIKKDYVPSGATRRPPVQMNAPTPQPSPISSTPIRVGPQQPIPMQQPVSTPNLPQQAPIPGPGGNAIQMTQPAGAAPQISQPQSIGNYVVPMTQPVGTPPVSPPMNIPGGYQPQMAQPVGTPPLPPSAPIPLNPQLQKYIQQMMQGPQLPSAGPGTTDPQVRALIHDLFKKVQPSQAVPPVP